MSKDWYQDIVDFHRATDTFIGNKPALPSADICRLRYSLIKEELSEALSAIAHEDLVDLADGIGDSIVVLIGTAISYGIDIRPVWDEIHRTNMAKVGGPRRSDGKILKPEGWKPPDIESILIAQGLKV